MKRVFFILLLVCFCLLSGCRTSYQALTYNEPVRGADSLNIHEGILSTRAQRIKYKKDGKTVAIIELSEPVMVAMAEQEENWGFFQFPGIGITEDGILRVTWQMAEDSHTSYGKVPQRKYSPMVSKDGGHTWYPEDKYYQTRAHGYHVEMSNGSRLQVSTPATKSVKEYKFFPSSVGKLGTYSYYREDQLPEDLRGVYFNYSDSGQTGRFQAHLNDPGLLRYAIGDQMPLLWWGSIKELADHSLVAGVYPTIYLDEKGKLTESGVSFYQSKDCGKNWDVLSRIPYKNDGITDSKGDRRLDEPSFEILPDSTFICIMRTGSRSPMCKSFSYDRGLTWTTPEPFTPNGVLPTIMLLGNGVLVLTSGRPGVQVRFSYDGGHNWTDAIDMIHFSPNNEVFDLSCGYVSIIEKDDRTFFMTYSDFTTKNEKGEKRKSIWVRKVRINRR